MKTTSDQKHLKIETWQLVIGGLGLIVSLLYLTKKKAAPATATLPQPQSVAGGGGGGGGETPSFKPPEPKAPSNGEQKPETTRAQNWLPVVPSPEKPGPVPEPGFRPTAPAPGESQHEYEQKAQNWLPIPH
jgi:hypothetical protein